MESSGIGARHLQRLLYSKRTFARTNQGRESMPMERNPGMSPEDHEKILQDLRDGLLSGDPALLEDLSFLAARWRRTGRRPEGADYLTRTQLRALCIAAGRDNELEDPVISFLYLEGWLQRWVLEELGHPSLIEQVIGRDPPVYFKPATQE